MVGRVWILLLVTAFTCSIPAHAEQTAAKGQSGQSAWVYDLPGVVAAKGTRVEIAGPIARRQDDKQLTLVIVGGSPVVGQFAELQGKQRTLPRLRIVERAAGSVDKDTEYTLTNVRVISTGPVTVPGKRTQAAQQVVVGFERIEARLGVSMNPGPPPGAPAIRTGSANVGWVFLPGEVEDPVALPVSELARPEGSGRLRVRLADPGRPPPELARLIESGRWRGELILVLPDQHTLDHVEFKLQGGAVVQTADELVFESPVMEILEGGGA